MGSLELSRRALVRSLLEGGVATRLVPAFAAAAAFVDADEARAEDPRPQDTRDARNTWAAFADTVIPPDEHSPGASAAGFVDVLFDPSFYQVFVGFEVPIGPAMRVLALDLDRRALAACRHRFAAADEACREEVLEKALSGPMRLIYEGMIALVKVVWFGAQRSTIGWDDIGYPGPADAHPDASPAGPAPAPPSTPDGNPP